ncbi:hypothetical protein SODALDRAFT_281511, partial [Sodiomyces alkalinus F11]
KGAGIGFGYTVYKGTTLIYSGKRPLVNAEVFNAEIVGARAGLNAALVRTSPSIKNITICLDNTTVI